MIGEDTEGSAVLVRGEATQRTTVDLLAQRRGLLTAQLVSGQLLLPELIFKELELLRLQLLPPHLRDPLLLGLDQPLVLQRPEDVRFVFILKQKHVSERFLKKVSRGKEALEVLWYKVGKAGTSKWPQTSAETRGKTSSNPYVIINTRLDLKGHESNFASFCR